MSVKSIRWTIADYLSRVACWLRGHKWYASDNYGSVPGNRAAELRQSVWERVVCLRPAEDDKEWLASIDRELTELGQLAGENWGHVWPKK